MVKESDLEDLEQSNRDCLFSHELQEQVEDFGHIKNPFPPHTNFSRSKSLFPGHTQSGCFFDCKTVGAVQKLSGNHHCTPWNYMMQNIGKPTRNPGVKLYVAYVLPFYAPSNLE